MKFASPVRALVLLAALTLSAIVGVGTSAAAPPPVQVQSSCTGDTISGSVWLKKGGNWPVSLALMSKAHASTGFVQSSAPKQVTGSGGEASFTFDVSALNAFAYRVDANGVQGREIPATSCAPGHQVPEAPMALLLPLSLLLVGGLLVVRGRRSGLRLLG
jgi:hypothetical protein